MKRAECEKDEAIRKLACTVPVPATDTESVCQYKLYSIHNTQKGFTIMEGIIEENPTTLVEMNGNMRIKVNIQTHQLLKVGEEEVTGIEQERVLDLNDNGERWEGDVYHQQPYGWGVLYDEEGEKAYEGFRIRNRNVCYGTSYYSDIQKIEYKGEWCDGKRWGKGTQYDRNGNVVFEGEWLNDDHVIEKRVIVTKENEEKIILHNYVEELIVNDECCNGMEWRVFDASLMPRIRLLQVGDECFENVEEVKLIGLEKLERVVIGKKSFTKEKNSFGNDPNRRFYLKNCEQLKELDFGRFSFSDYTTCEIENADCLERIKMGNINEWSYNFNYASLELKSGY